MRKIHLAIFFLFFLFVSIMEGVHFVLDLRFLTFILYCVPFLLFFLDKKQEYKIPKIFAVLSGIYLASMLISIFYSRDRGVSLELFFRDISLFLLAIYVHAHSEEIKKHLPKAVIFTSFVFIIVSLCLLLIPAGQGFISEYRLNLLFNPYYPHKTIGDYLTFGIIISSCFFLIEKREWGKYALCVFVPLFLLSFSRTAYITLVISLFVFLFLKRQLLKKIPLGLTISLVFNVLLTVALFFTFATTNENALFTYVQNMFQKTISPRPFMLSRITFWTEGMRGFLLSPFTGIGPGTFEYISFRFTNHIFLWANTSFNLIIDLMAEQGVLSALSLLCLFLYILITSKKRNVFYLLFVVLFISFMGFSTYAYLQIRLLFFIVLGLLLQSENDSFVIRKGMLFLSSACAIVFIQILFLHTLFIQFDEREIAHALYPFDSRNMQIIIGKERFYIHNEKNIEYYLNQYNSFFGVDPTSLEYIGDVYASMGGKSNEKKAIHYYEESFVWGRYSGGNVLTRMAKLYELKKRVEGEGKAQSYVKGIIGEYAQMIKENEKFGSHNENQEMVYEELRSTYN